VSCVTYARGIFASVTLLGVFHARRLRAHELALRVGWDRVHAALRVTHAFYDPLRFELLPERGNVAVGRVPHDEARFRV
jgi:hypothetical protein